MNPSSTCSDAAPADVFQRAPMRSTGMDTTAACTGRIRRGASASLIGMLPIFSAFGTSFDARADELHYQSFWVEGRATSLHTAALSLARFKATGQKLAETGHVLIDVETAVRDGQRRYAGLWTLGSGSTIFEGPIGAIPMREAMQRRSAQGLRLVDFETFETASGRRQYLGVWRPGPGEQVLTAPMSQQAFVARGQQFVQQGMRLRDVEVENRDGRLMYSGLFRSGAGLNLLTPPMSMAQFRDALAARRADGQELLDFETIEGTPNVVGVFRSGDALAEITGSRDFTAQFALAQSKFNDGRRTRDFELTVIETPEAGGGATDPDNPPPLPPNPAYLRFSDDLTVRLEFQEQVDESLFRLTLPTAALPDWLPKDAEGTPIFPDGHCGLRVRRADSIFGQVPGDSAVSTPPFNVVADVSALGSEPHLGGIGFSGPIGACTDTQEPWRFPFPFTTEAPFVPLPNLSLVVELEPGAAIDFIKDAGPIPKPIDVDKLFKDDSLKKLKAMVKFWNDLLEEGKNVDQYCPTIGTFWKKLCSQFPEADEVCSAEVAELPDC